MPDESIRRGTAHVESEPPLGSKCSTAGISSAARAEELPHSPAETPEAPLLDLLGAAVEPPLFIIPGPLPVNRSSFDRVLLKDRRVASELSRGVLWLSEYCRRGPSVLPKRAEPTPTNRLPDEEPQLLLAMEQLPGGKIAKRSDPADVLRRCEDSLATMTRLLLWYSKLGLASPPANIPWCIRGDVGDWEPALAQESLPFTKGVSLLSTRITAAEEPTVSGGGC